MAAVQMLDFRLDASVDDVAPNVTKLTAKYNLAVLGMVRAASRPHGGAPLIKQLLGMGVVPDVRSVPRSVAKMYDILVVMDVYAWLKPAQGVCYLALGQEDKEEAIALGKKLGFFRAGPVAVQAPQRLRCASK